ncbi:bacterial low temperature requirement A protein-domain-containing protein [Cunninghamella echinulata]|nr:bacterial low temperature requirement A protein-domain-containing protein [Cunninghamella echinulata]
MVGTSTVRSGPSIRQPLRQPRNNNNNNEAILEEEEEIEIETSSIKMENSNEEGINIQEELTTTDDQSITLEEEQNHRSLPHNHITHINHHPHLLSTGSIISKITTRSKNESVVAPLHDKDGKPILSHGPETFGDIMLHPFKEFDLHRRRVSLFEAEKKEWDEKHPGKDHSHTGTGDAAVDAHSNSNSHDAPTAIDEEAPPVINKPKVKTVIHFRHLMGEQKIRVTSELAQQLIDPLSLTNDEVLHLYKIKDTDDLVEFFHRTKRDYSLKIHKTVNLEKKKAEFRKDSRKGSKQDLEEEEKKEAESEKTTDPKLKENTTFLSEKSQGRLSTAPLPPNSIELNKNVFLELKYIVEQEEHYHEKTRRPLFVLPDPDLSDEIGEETSATWVELFSDVFYVGWLSSFTHTHHMVDSASLGEYAGWFVVMWWSWCSSALYSARYDNGDVMHHIYKIIDLCGLVGMAGSSNGYLSESRGFIYGYMVMKAVLLIQYAVVLWAATLSGSFSRIPLSTYVAINSIAIILWGVSLLYIDEEDKVKRLVLWYVSIGADVVVNMKLQRHKQVSLAASHLAERFGLFTIIILGENCISFIRMVSESHAAVNVVVAIMFSVIIIFSYFFMYFDDFCKEILNEVRISQIWMYLHFPLHLCQVAFGMALTDVITIYQQHWEIPGKAAADCLLLSHTAGPASPSTHGGNESSGIESHNTTGSAIEPVVHTIVASGQSLLNSLMMASASTGESSTESALLAEACEEIVHHNGIDYVFKAFWITGGLILCINALIKLVNTPVAAKWSRLICGSRVINAIIFFGLSAATFEKLNGLAMLGIMMASLLLQSFIDLLD